jgi:hypothetical protein
MMVQSISMAITAIKRVASVVNALHPHAQKTSLMTS